MLIFFPFRLSFSPRPISICLRAWGASVIPPLLSVPPRLAGAQGTARRSEVGGQPIFKLLCCKRAGFCSVEIYMVKYIQPCCIQSSALKQQCSHLALVSSTQRWHHGAPGLCSHLTGAELTFRPLWWALQPAHVLQTDRLTKFQSFPSLLGPRRAAGESSFSGCISWGVTVGTPCWLCLCLFFSGLCKSLLVHSCLFLCHLLVLGPLWLLRHLKATFHPRGQLSPSLGQPQGWAGSAGQLREKEMGREQLAAKGQEVLTGRTPGPHVCLDVIWITSTAEMR